MVTKKSDGKPIEVTEEDLENFSGAFDLETGPDTPWSRIVESVDDETKAEWRKNLGDKYIPDLCDEELNNLKDALFDDSLSTPWSVIVDAAPEEWKEKWRNELKKKYDKK
ncbi:hypothetical protein [Neptunomonas qingdaonensis]|uniref:Uncharacterized protein n=1 Tax=Neptunomonas qingdaonensis TaxID=1045558 RepID=A0A1I2TN15_9GAMM|nr:hypothetical protein [Neptunomonas qingdaonensis]SFG66355.1 hypothetical protein SAMN05216175_110145 [Neptunomonas qingdaonensis]